MARPKKNKDEWNAKSYTKATGGDNVPVVELKEGETVVLRYLHSREVDTGQNRKARLHYFENRSKEEVKIWGCAVLDSGLKEVDEKEIIRISHEGYGNKKKGQKPPKLLRVYRRK